MKARMGMAIPAVNLEGAKGAKAASNKEEVQAVGLVKALSMSQGNYGPDPVVNGQFALEPGFWKLGAMEAAYFAIPDDLAKMNELLAKTLPEDSPRVLLAAPPDKYPPEGGGKIQVVVWFKRVNYLQVPVEFFSGKKA